jgi:sugar lactone lactonase YvrE
MVDATTVLAFSPSLRIAGRGSAAHQFKETLSGIAVDPDDRIYAVGDSVVKIFDAQGELLRQWPTSVPGASVAIDDNGRVWVGQWRQVEIFDGQGKLSDTWRDPEGLGLVTAIDPGGDDVFFADATVRWVRRYDRDGRFLNNIGSQHRKGGFHIPNGVLDFAIDGDGTLHVANPGMHRVERYKPDGELLGHFGRFDGRDPQGFSGCCNPTNLTLDGAGRVVVSEKAGPRAKVYSPDGRLLAVVADDVFDPGAKNMDLAVDSRGRIYVVDTVKLEICVFEPTAGRGTA